MTIRTHAKPVSHRPAIQTRSVGKVAAGAPRTAESTREDRPDGFERSHGGHEAPVAAGARGVHPQLATRGEHGSLVELARSLEAGKNPIRLMTEKQRTELMQSSIRALGRVGSGKATHADVLPRSAAATVLLAVAKASKGSVRAGSLEAYVHAMTTEKDRGLRASMMINLESSRIPLPDALQPLASAVREEILPSQPPYDAWFKGKHPALEVRHYVMDEFMRGTMAAYRKRGFTVEKEGKDGTVLTKVLKDPKGQNPDVKVRVVLRPDSDNVLRDIGDPKVQMILYSGHAQLGGILAKSLQEAPRKAEGQKWIQLYQCRGKQTAGEVLTRYPGVHLTTSNSSAYDSDDNTVLSCSYDLIARRGDYHELRKAVAREDLIQPTSNYIFPNDRRFLATRDSDDDGIKDVSKLGTDVFYDPGRREDARGPRDFRPLDVGPDPQKISADNVDHAVSFANTAFFYFSEENKASPLTVKQTDSFLSDGWFRSDSDEALRIRESTKDGKTYYRISINSRYAHQNREAITAMVLFEMQRHLCEKTKGHFSPDDVARGLLLVQEYVDLFCDYSEDCDAVLHGFARKYNVSNLSYDVMFEAAAKDGHDGFGTQAALAFMKERGIRLAAPA